MQTFFYISVFLTFFITSLSADAVVRTRLSCWPMDWSSQFWLSSTDNCWLETEKQIGPSNVVDTSVYCAMRTESRVHVSPRVGGARGCVAGFSLRWSKGDSNTVLLSPFDHLKLKPATHPSLAFWPGTQFQRHTRRFERTKTLGPGILLMRC